MKIRMAVTAACLTAAGALLAAPATLANAVPAQHPAAGAVAAVIPLHLTAGSRTVSVTIPAAARSATADAASGQGYVDIRVGKNNCGGYKGTVYYGAGGIVVSGTLWDNCNYYTPDTTVYLYVSFTDARGAEDYDMAHVTGTQNTENLGDIEYQSFPPSNIYADTCLKWDNGWGCGPKSQRID